MGNNNSQTAQSINDELINNMISNSQGTCAMNSNSSNIELESLYEINNIDCVMNQTINANTYNILQSALDETQWSEKKVLHLIGL